MSLFVDTSGLLAALVANDQNHAHARPTLELALRGSEVLHATSYVVVETWALLQARVGLEAARIFEQRLRPRLEMRWIDEALHARGVARLTAAGRRTLSLVDATSLAAMEELGLARVFTYDDDFRREGCQVVQVPTDL